jgi:hypothetical protein
MSISKDGAGNLAAGGTGAAGPSYISKNIIENSG